MPAPQKLPTCLNGPVSLSSFSRRHCVMPRNDEDTTPSFNHITCCVRPPSHSGLCQQQQLMRIIVPVRHGCDCFCLCARLPPSCTLLSFVMELLKNSVAMQEQVLSCKGFLVIGYTLEKVGQIYRIHFVPPSSLQNGNLAFGRLYIHSICKA